MLAYWLLFFYPAWKSLFGANRKYGWPEASFLILLLSVFVGLRYEVGGDWLIYILNQEQIADDSIFQIVSNRIEDVGYELLSYFSYVLGLGIYGSNFICAAIFSTGLVLFSRSQPRPWFSLALSVPYLVIVVAMGYTRQSVAIGLVMLGILSLENSRVRLFFLYVLLASLFHKTAAILSVAALPVVLERGNLSARLLSLALLFASSLGLFYSFLAPRLDFYLYGYEQQSMQSEGAAIRVAMVLFPALIFIMFNRRFNAKPSENVIWLGFSWAGVACAIALFALNSSTAVDRIALYCIPLQMYVGSRIPDIKLVKCNPRLLTFLIILLAFSIQFVWLNFAVTAFAWLPYRNLLIN